jgi:hypothetical protein
LKGGSLPVVKLLEAGVGDRPRSPAERGPGGALPKDLGKALGQRTVESRGDAEEGSVLLLGVLVLAVGLAEERVIGEAAEDHGEQVRLRGDPGGEAFPEGRVTECPAGLAERRAGDPQEAAGECLQCPGRLSRGAASPVDDVTLGLVQGRRAEQAPVGGGGVGEGEGGLLVGAELLVDVAQILPGAGDELGDTGGGEGTSCPLTVKRIDTSAVGCQASQRPQQSGPDHGSWHRKGNVTTAFEQAGLRLLARCGNSQAFR